MDIECHCRNSWKHGKGVQHQSGTMAEPKGRKLQWRFRAGSVDAGHKLYKLGSSNGYSITDPKGQLYWIDMETVEAGQWIETSDYNITFWGFKTSNAAPDWLASAFLKNFERAGVEVEAERRAAATKWYNFLKKSIEGSQIIEKAVQWAINIANDNSHGYDQTRRDGPDYDCSSLICWAYYNAGFNTRPGYTPATGSMYDVFVDAGFEDVTAGCVKWPLSVIRLQGSSIGRLAKVSDYILQKWRGYTDEEAFIFSETDGVPHNTITPIARMNGNLYEMDLVLRNNITTEDRPWGVYHPEEKLHHIKKENIGLIEVMGLAVLPSRLKKEMDILAKAIIEGKNIHDIEEIKIHADWVDEWLDSYDITTENIESIIQKEIADCFVQVLECAGVYKRTEKGIAAFKRFLSVL